jgi:hypothetical protein
MIETVLPGVSVWAFSREAWATSLPSGLVEMPKPPACIGMRATSAPASPAIAFCRLITEMSSVPPLAPKIVPPPSGLIVTPLVSGKQPNFGIRRAMRHRIGRAGEARLAIGLLDPLDDLVGGEIDDADMAAAILVAFALGMGEHRMLAVGRDGKAGRPKSLRSRYSPRRPRACRCWRGRAPSSGRRR